MKAVRAALSFTLLLNLGLAASEAGAQTPRGSELRVNPGTAGAQRLPDVATGPDGRFVVVWKEGLDNQDPAQPVYVMARVYDAAGTPRTGEIRVASLKPHVFDLPASGPAVAMAPDGRFVVVWGGGVEDPFLGFGRRYAADGRPLGQRFPLARNRTGGQRDPDVAMAPDGSFVAVWYQLTERQDDHEVPFDIFFRRFGVDGRPLGPEALAIGGYDEESSPRVAMRPNGDFVIAGQEWGGDSYEIVAQLFSRSGAPISDQLRVNEDLGTAQAQLGPAVAMTPDGRFAIAWTDRAADSTRDPSLEGEIGSYGVAVRFYSPEAVPLGPGHYVNAFLPGMQSSPAVTPLQNGGFLVLWASGGAQDGDGSGIFARVYGAAGRPRGQEFRINLNRRGDQSAPAVSVAPNGKGAAVWDGPDGNGTGIFTRLIGPPRSNG